MASMPSTITATESGRTMPFREHKGNKKPKSAGQMDQILSTGSDQTLFNGSQSTLTQISQTQFSQPQTGAETHDSQLSASGAPNQPRVLRDQILSATIPSASAPHDSQLSASGAPNQPRVLRDQTLSATIPSASAPSTDCSLHASERTSQSSHPASQSAMQPFGSPRPADNVVSLDLESELSPREHDFAASPVSASRSQAPPLDPCVPLAPPDRPEQPSSHRTLPVTESTEASYLPTFPTVSVQNRHRHPRLHPRSADAHQLPDPSSSISTLPAASAPNPTQHHPDSGHASGS
jgi:hypothetical protein